MIKSIRTGQDQRTFQQSIIAAAVKWSSMGFIPSLVFGFISLHHRCTPGPPTPFHISTLLCHLSSSLRTVAKRKSAASVHPFLRGRYAWMGKVRSNMITLPKSNILHPVYFITNLFLIIIITTIIMMTIFFVIVFILVEHGCRSFRRLLIIIITITTIVNIIAFSTAGLLLYKSWLKTKCGRNSSAIHFGNVLNCISSNLSHLIIFHQQESGKKNIKLWIFHWACGCMHTTTTISMAFWSVWLKLPALSAEAWAFSLAFAATKAM